MMVILVSSTRTPKRGSQAGNGRGASARQKECQTSKELKMSHSWLDIVYNDFQRLSLTIIWACFTTDCYHQSNIAALADDESVRGPAPSMGRITGSASIETLVIITTNITHRVAFELFLLIFKMYVDLYKAAFMMTFQKEWSWCSRFGWASKRRLAWVQRARWWLSFTFYHYLLIYYCDYCDLLLWF